MVNRTALAAVLMTLTAPSWAINAALRNAEELAAGQNASAIYDGAAKQPASAGEADIQRAAEGAQTRGGLTTAKDAGAVPDMTAEVPAPTLNAGKKDANDAPGFFGKLFSDKSLMYGLGGAAAAAAIGGLMGGPIGAVIGGLIGAVGGYFMSKLLTR